MALSETNDVKRTAAPALLLRLRRRAAEWLDGEHSLTQRMAGTAFAIRIASAGIMFGSQVLLARWMGGAEFGIYVYVGTWLILVGDLVHLGVPLTAQRFVPEYTQAGSIDLLRGYLAGSQWTTFAVASVAAAAGALIVRALENSLDGAVIMPFYLACAALPFYALTFMMDGLARAYNWINLALLSPYILRPLIVIAGMAALRIAGVTLDATAAMAVLAGATWLTALNQLLRLDRRLKSAVAPGYKAYDFRLWLGTALPIILVWGMYTLLTSTDILVLKQFRPAEDVAHYYAAAKTLALVSIIHFAVAATAAHRFTAYHAAGDRDGLAAFAGETIRWVFWPSLIACLLVIVLGRPVLMLFGEGFVAGYPVMAILAVGQLARASIGPAERLLNMLGQQRICALAYAAAFTFNIMACIALAPAYGGVGAASATAGAFVVESTLLYLIARRRLGLHMFVWRTRQR